MLSNFGQLKQTPSKVRKKKNGKGGGPVSAVDEVGSGKKISPQNEGSKKGNKESTQNRGKRRVTQSLTGTAGGGQEGKQNIGRGGGMYCRSSS